MRRNGFGQRVSLANCLKSAALGQAGPWALPERKWRLLGGGLSSRGWGGLLSASAPGPVQNTVKSPALQQRPAGSRGGGRALFLLAQIAGPWPPPSQAMHFLCVSGGRSSRLEGVCVRTPAEALVPALQTGPELSSLLVPLSVEYFRTKSINTPSAHISPCTEHLPCTPTASGRVCAG